MGEPLRRWISEYWNNLLAYADSQPRSNQRPFRSGAYSRLGSESYEMASLARAEDQQRRLRSVDNAYDR